MQKSVESLFSVDVLLDVFGQLEAVHLVPDLPLWTTDGGQLLVHDDDLLLVWILQVVLVHVVPDPLDDVSAHGLPDPDDLVEGLVTVVHVVPEEPLHSHRLHAHLSSLRSSSSTPL